MRKKKLLGLILFISSISVFAETTYKNTPYQILTSTTYIGGTSDDASQNNLGATDLGEDRIYLGGAKGLPGFKKENSAFRFKFVELPDDAEIVDAYIEFYSAKDNSPAATAKIYVEQGGNAEKYKGFPFNITARKYNSHVMWDMAQWDGKYQYQRTPNLKSIIEENIYKYNWKNGDNLAFLFKGKSVNNGGAVYTADYGEEEFMPKLIIKYYSKNNIVEITNPQEMIGLHINEVAGKGTTEEEEDWIELYNDHEAPINITGGVFVSAVEADKEFELKNIRIEPKGYLILIADKAPEKGNTHTNFKISADGETIKLRKGTLEEEVYIPSAIFNETIGRYPNGTGDFATLIKPTYNEENVEAKKVEFSLSHERGIYPSPFSINISIPQGTSIKYTLDGTDPSEKNGSETKNGKIEINSSCVLKVYAYDNNGNSGIISHTYVLEDNYPREKSNQSRKEWLKGGLLGNKHYITTSEYAEAIKKLPIVSISGVDLIDGWKPSYVEYIDKHIYPDHTNFSSKAGATKFGQASVRQYNSGVKFKFTSEYGVERPEYKFFEKFPNDKYKLAKKIQAIQLKEGQDGPSTNLAGLGIVRFDEMVTMHLAKQMGKYGLDTRFVNFYVNGKYRGVKTMRNEFKSQNISETFGGSAKDYTEVDMKDKAFSTGNVAEDGDVNLWNSVKNSAKKKDLQTFKSMIDLEDLIKFQILFMFIDTETEAVAILRNNQKEQKSIFNINDTDGAFNAVAYTSNSINLILPKPLAGGGGNFKYKWMHNKSLNGPGGFFGKFKDNLEFKTLVKDANYEAFGPTYDDADNQERDGKPLSISNVQSQIKDAVEQVDAAYKLDAAYMRHSKSKDVYSLWKDIDVERVGNQVPERVNFSIKKWKDKGLTHTLKPVLFNTQNLNIIRIENQKQPEPTEIYYTSDGSDPLGPNGNISDKALLYIYGKGISLPNGEYTLIARPKGKKNWGPKSTVNVVVSQSDVNNGDDNNEENENIIIQEKDVITAYPNPFKDILNIDIENRKTPMVLNIYSYNSVLVHSQKIITKKTGINLFKLKPGIYIVNIIDAEGKKSSKKIIKK